jgi:RsiW-degrading membrane proteinase PrsW (M82 family)
VVWLHEILLQNSAPGWALIGMVSASALFWMQYVDTKDRYAPEPRTRLVFAFLLGVVAAAGAVAVFRGLGALGLPHLSAGGLGWMAVYCYVFIGPIEEGAKLLVAWWVVFRWAEFDEPIDGFVYAAAISLGFASLENLLHLPGLPLLEQLARTATLPLTHTLFAAVWGLGIARARLLMSPGWRRQLWQVGSMVAAMLLHSSYDFLIFAWQATWATSLLALFLWIFVIWRAHQLVHHHRRAARRPLC